MTLLSRIGSTSTIKQSTQKINRTPSSNDVLFLPSFLNRRGSVLAHMNETGKEGSRNTQRSYLKTLL
eukprot:scaffold10098_cov96-Cylindrotheca_fusiformis.AAC.6